ncbi:MAG TPA: hypothetical protein VGZ22_04785 [Isosphaeraceae bacterium]|jgi:hypothetical protein|nr:hypothetical protein [Isosphaeraceae bacterium]
MTYRPLRWLAVCSSIVLINSTISLAQDGQPATGPSATPPRTNNHAGNVGRSTPNTPGRQTTDLAAPVPATVPGAGLRGARLDLPRAAVRPVAAVPFTPPQAGVGIQIMEGVITQVMPAGRNVPGEQIRITIDPDQDWTSFVTTGPLGYADRSLRPGAEPTGPPGLDMTLTSGSYIASYERTTEGYDLLGVSLPPRSESRNSRPATGSQAPAEFRATPTGAASIRQGGFVSVRYRSVGNMNEVLNLNLISVPSIEGLTPALRTPAPALTPAAARVAPRTAPARLPRVPSVPSATLPAYTGPQ